MGLKLQQQQMEFAACLPTVVLLAQGKMMRDNG
jgi:hypothetical protein